MYTAIDGGEDNHEEGERLYEMPCYEYHLCMLRFEYHSCMPRYGCLSCIVRGHIAVLEPRLLTFQIIAHRYRLPPTDCRARFRG
jgi:hypothetical protein